MRLNITKLSMAKYLLAGALLFGGNYTAQTVAAQSSQEVSALEITTVNPAPSETESVESLSTITLTTNYPVSVQSGNVVKVYKDGDTEVEFCNGTLSVSNGTTVTVTLETSLTDYGRYAVVIPDGAISSVGMSTGDITLTYKVGTFESVSVRPATDKAVESLKEVTIFMSDRVGGVLDGAKLNVYKDGDTEVAYTTATIDILNSNANEATITLADELTEYGKYTIVVPANVIFDKYYNGEDAVMSGATGNEAFELTYQVGLFDIAKVTPEPNSDLKTLKEVEVFMTAPVGGFLDGAKLNVYRNGDFVATATLDWATEPYGNDVRVIIEEELAEYGDYMIEIPAGVIFDKYYNGGDAFMTGARGNEAIQLFYHVGLFEVAATMPENGATVASFNEVTVFMTAPVGGFNEAAKASVTKNGVEVATATIDWASSPLSNDVVLILDKTINEDGEYTITIPAGTIFDSKYDELDPFFSGAKSNEEIVITIKVSTSTGIENINVEGGNNAVYSISGMQTKKVVKGAVNIINGKKVFVK